MAEVEPRSLSRDAPAQEDAVERLLFECLERAHAGGEAAVDELLRSHPEHAGQVREELERLRLTGLLDRPGREHPERLGEFRLIERLGGGGMGVVYRALQEPLAREVALKIVRPEHLFFPEARERFRREVLAVARLQHPGIVPIYTVSEAEGVPYFAMELIEGCTLAQVLERLDGRRPEELSGQDLADTVEQACAERASATAGPAPSARFEGDWIRVSVGLAREVAEALEHAHGRGVLHRDVKPSNVALTRVGRPLLVDFGLASLGDAGELTGSGFQPGSVPYMSPEQLRGEKVDARTDVYSLGLVLYELLTLGPCFPRGKVATEALRRRILSGEVAPPSRRNRRIPRDVEVVCLKALAPERADRYATAADFARDLGNLLQRRPIEAQRPGALLRAVRWSQRNPVAARAAAAGAALAVGAGAFLAWQRETHARELRVERDAARQHFEEVRSLATGFLFDFHDAIDDLPGSTPARELVVERALELFEKLAAAAEGDARLKADLAWARVRLAQALGQPAGASLGDWTRARQEYERALELYDELVRAGPGDSDLRYRRAWARKELATLTEFGGDLEGGLALYARTLDEVESLMADSPEDRRPESLFAALRMERSSALAKAGRLDEARADGEAALALWERLVQAWPDSVDYRYNRVGAHRNLGHIHRMRGEHEESERELGRVIALTEELLQGEPDSDSLQHVLAESHLDRAGLFSDTGRHEEAIDVLRKGCGELEARRRRDPRNALALCLLVTMQSGLSSELVNVGRPREAIEAAEAALALAREALALGWDSEVERDACDALRARAEAQRDLGDGAAAVASCGALAARLERDLVRMPANPELAEIAAEYLPWCDEQIGALAAAEGALEAVEEMVAELPGSAAGEDASEQVGLGAAALALARVASLRGDGSRARLALDEATLILERTAARDEAQPYAAAQRIQALALDAELRRRSGDSAGALSACEEAAGSIARHREGLKSSPRAAQVPGVSLPALIGVARALERTDLVQRLEASWDP